MGRYKEMLQIIAQNGQLFLAGNLLLLLFMAILCVHNLLPWCHRMQCVQAAGRAFRYPPTLLRGTPA